MSAPFRGHTLLLRNEGNEHKQNIGEASSDNTLRLKIVWYDVSENNGQSKAFTRLQCEQRDTDEQMWDMIIFFTFCLTLAPLCGKFLNAQLSKCKITSYSRLFIADFTPLAQLQ